METIKSEINKILEEFKYIKHVPADICGKRVMLTEVEVRALQVMCKRYASQGKYDEFIHNVVVYTGPNAKEINPFRKDGKFAEMFEEGFYTITGDLAFEIL